MTNKPDFSAFVFGGAFYTPEDYDDLQSELDGSMSLHPLPKENDRLSFGDFRRYGKDASRMWHEALLEQDRHNVAEQIGEMRSQYTGVLAHCVGIERALNIVEEFRLDFAILMNPPAKSIDCLKFSRLTPPPKDIRLERYPNPALKGLLHPLTPNVDEVKYRRFITRTFARFARDPHIVESMEAEGEWTHWKSTPLKDQIAEAERLPGRKIYVLNDSTEPFFDKSVWSWNQCDMPGTGHFPYMFNPKETAECMKKYVFSDITAECF